MATILLVLLLAAGMGTSGLPVLPVLSWTAVMVVAAWLVRFGFTGGGLAGDRQGRWYRRW